MVELYYSCNLSNRKSICISTLTDEQLIQSGVFQRFEGVGYYLYQRDILDGEEEIEVLARMETDESAEKIAQLLQSVSGAFPSGLLAASILSTGD